MNYKKSEYKCYVLWRAVKVYPDVLDTNVLRVCGASRRTRAMLQLKTQQEFAEYLGLNKDTLQRWKNLEDFKKLTIPDELSDHITTANKVVEQVEEMKETGKGISKALKTIRFKNL